MRGWKDWPEKDEMTGRERCASGGRIKSNTDFVNSKTDVVNSNTFSFNIQFQSEFNIIQCARTIISIDFFLNSHSNKSKVQGNKRIRL